MAPGLDQGVKPGMIFFTSSPIINETTSLLRSRGYVSFAMMARLGIRMAFTFDAHFRTAGFDTLGAHSQPREARS